MGYQNRRGCMAMIAAVFVFIGGFWPSDIAAQEPAGAVREAASDKPKVVEARLINSRDIELYWSQEVTGAGPQDEEHFTVTVGGVDNPLYNSWYEGPIVYYNQKTSIRLKNPIQKIEQMGEIEKLQTSTELPEIKVTVKGEAVKNAGGVFADEAVITVGSYIPFYRKQRTLACGVKVLGSETVSDAAMDKAKEMLEVVLNNQQMAERMGASGCMLGVYGKGNIAYDIPEHRYTYDENYLYVEGFGGPPLASIKDANVLRFRTGDYTTGYRDESILVHEFGHTVKYYGLTEEQQKEWTRIYQKSTGAGKWANTYAGSNEDEYFATLSAMWFNAMDDTWDGEVDGVRGPINTRIELKVYDRDAYDFLAAIYPEDIYLPQPWENGTVPNNFVYACSVTFSYEEGGLEKTEIAAVKKGGRIAEAEIPVPQKEGYIFSGWKSGDTDVDLTRPITADLELQAAWTPKEDSKDPENPNPEKPNPGGSDGQEPQEPDIPAPPNPGGSDNAQNPGSETEVKNFQVTFIYLSGNKTKRKVVTVKEGETLLASDIPIPVRNGYICSGWTSGGKRFALSSAVTSNLELKVKWTKVTVKKPSVSSVKVKGRKMTVAVKKVSGTSGYKVAWSKDNKFKKSVKSKFITKNKLIQRKMKKGTYYVRVQAYKLDSAGKKVLSKASKVRKVTVG